MTPSTEAGRQLLDDSPSRLEGRPYAARVVLPAILAIEEQARAEGRQKAVRLGRMALNEVNEAMGFLVQRVDDFYVEQARIHLEHAQNSLRPVAGLNAIESDR